MVEAPLSFDGIDGTTGAYLFPPIPLEAVAKHILGRPCKGEEEKDLRFWSRNHSEAEHRRGPMEGVDPDDLAEAGWAILFARDVDPTPIKEALGKLLCHRRERAAHVSPRRYRELFGEEGYHPGDSKTFFLRRHKLGSGPAVPDKLPYYVLIIGDPQTIPFSFQYQLDVQYAVGRLHFETLEEYAAYAEYIVNAETPASPPVNRHAMIFGAASPEDRATEALVRYLAKPMGQMMANRPGWTVSTLLGDEARKKRLSGCLSGRRCPDLLFTTSHGVSFHIDDPRQEGDQGALLCSDWPGPGAGHGRIPEDYYFAAGDVPAAGSLQGLITFHTACFGAGTPHFDDFAHRNEWLMREIAPRAMLSRLPQRLLARGASAVVGHVDRLWGHSYLSAGVGATTAHFESTLQRLMKGHRLGYAMEFFNQRHAELAVELSDTLEAGSMGKQIDARELVLLWTARNDARNYIVLGDPATHFPVMVQSGNAETSVSR